MLKFASQDKIHQRYRMNTMKELFEVQKRALKSGALMSTLSGSGSSFFNLVYEDDAKKIKDDLKNAFPNFKIEIFSLNNSGFEIKKI
jgi:homoserine kinase